MEKTALLYWQADSLISVCVCCISEANILNSGYFLTLDSGHTSIIPVNVMENPEFKLWVCYLHLGQAY